MRTDFIWIDGETRTNVSIVTELHDHYDGCAARPFLAKPNDAEKNERHK